MTICETWGISAARALEFFETQRDVMNTGEGEFVYDSCRIRITELPEQQLGSLRFNRTELVMEGEAEALELIHRRFMLRFLSAGG